MRDAPVCMLDGLVCILHCARSRKQEDAKVKNQCHYCYKLGVLLQDAGVCGKSRSM